MAAEFSPGRKPGEPFDERLPALEEGGRNSCRSYGAHQSNQSGYPGLTPGALAMPPAFLGSLKDPGLVPLFRRWLCFLVLGLFLFTSPAASSAEGESLISNLQEGLEMPVQERARVRAPELIPMPARETKLSAGRVRGD